jgi:hypothetical protein
MYGTYPPAAAGSHPPEQRAGLLRLAQGSRGSQIQRNVPFTGRILTSLDRKIALFISPVALACLSSKGP